MNHARNHRSGFTLVELLLAMTFISFLLVAITMTIIQVSSIYNKGLTLRAVGQAGESVTQDIRRSVESAQPLSLGTTPEGGPNLRQMVNVGGDINKPDGGRLCTGSYTYVWNNGTSMRTPVNKYATGDELIRLVKVMDNGSQYCADPSKEIEKTGAVEMLEGGDRELAVQSFAIKEAAVNPESSQALYLITMEIGTNDDDTLNQNATVATIDTSCKPPSEGVKLDDYCAVNRFEFTARAGNTGGLR